MIQRDSLQNAKGLLLSIPQGTFLADTTINNNQIAYFAPPLEAKDGGTFFIQATDDGRCVVWQKVRESRLVTLLNEGA